MPTIDCFFQYGELDSADILEQQLIENLLREDLRPLEQAKAFSSLMEINGWNGKQVAEVLHVSPSTVSRALALLDLPADVQQRVDTGELAAHSAYELGKLPQNSVATRHRHQTAYRNQDSSRCPPASWETSPQTSRLQTDLSG